MIAQRTAQMMAILSGIGGFLSCLALSVAARWIFSSRRFTTTVIKGPPPPKEPVAREVPEAASSAISPVTPAQPGIRVIRTIEPALDWEERDDRLIGSYQTSSGSYDGYIRNWQSENREFYIINPPAALKDHAHGKALNHRGQGRYQITFSIAPDSTIAGVRDVERMLAEAGRDRPQTIRPVVRPRQRIPAVVRPKHRPYWQLKDWKVQGTQLVGQYQTPQGSAQGYIKQYRAPRPRFFIMNPPRELRRHPHWICFHRIGGNRFSIHFSPAPKNPDDGIRAVEKVLAEALRSRRRAG